MLAVSASLIVVYVFVAVAILGLRVYREYKWFNPTFWEEDIAAFETQDRQNPPPKDEIVFVGSSSIRMWDTLADDMAPLTIIQRGFGGARLNDVVYYANRIVVPYEPKAIVLFAGTNDLAGDRRDKTPDELLASYIEFVDTIHSKMPGTLIYYIAITPTEARWEQWPQAKRTNQLIQEYTKTDERLHFIDTTQMILNVDSRPKQELFQKDRLHLNNKGYAVWTSIIKPILEKDLGDVP
jgi:lysophospholipase L1-like esterase